MSVHHHDVETESGAGIGMGMVLGIVVVALIAAAVVFGLAGGWGNWGAPSSGRTDININTPNLPSGGGGVTIPDGGGTGGGPAPTTP